MISIGHGGITVGDARLHLVSGSVHYWRLDRDLWPRILDRVADMGFRIVQSYIPWSVHEMRPGSFDFGRYDPRKDVGAFIDLLAERGMYFLARPGPHINAEITYFGYPKRLFEDRDLWSVSGTGAPVVITAPPRFFPALSYAHDRLYEEFGVYLDALCPILAERQHPDGALIGIQPDNEMSLFFRTGAYDHDYSPAARARYAAFLKEKYEDPAALSETYGKAYEHFDQVPLPVRFDAEDRGDIPYYLDWIEFKERSLLDPLFRIAAQFRQRGLTRLLTFHNFPPGRCDAPFNIGQAERELDVVGIDCYLQKRRAGELRQQMLRVAGRSRLPFVPEFGAGCYPWWPPLDLEDHVFTTLYSLMHGIRAFNFYMIVDRERWYGSPVKRNGEVEARTFGFFRRFNELLSRTDLPAMERVVQAGVVRGRDYDRLEKAASLFSPVPPLVIETHLDAEAMCDEGMLGLSRCVQIEHDRQINAWRALLDEAGVPYDLPDTDADPAVLARYRLLFAPTFEFASRAMQEVLIDYARGGGTLVVGPDIPEMDERMREAGVLGDHTKMPAGKLLSEPVCVWFECGRGRIVLLAQPLPAGPSEKAPWSAGLAAELIRMAGVETPFVPTDRAVQTTLFREDGRRILFVANPTADRRVADLPAEGASRLVDLWTDQRFEASGRIQLELAPYTVRILEVSA